MLETKELIAHFDTHHGEVKEILADHGARLAATKEQLADLEQKFERGGAGGNANGGADSLGAQFVKSEEFKALSGSASQRGRAEFKVKATITSLTTDAAGSAGALGTANHRDGLVLKPRRRLTIRDLMPVIPVSSSSVEFPRIKTVNNNAAPVAEGAAKPSSDLQIEMVSIPTRTIAHWVKASRQVLDDAPQLQGIIDSELLYGLGVKEEGQFLTGDGTGQNVLGLIPQSTAYSAAFVLDGATMIDMIGLAILQCDLADLPADGIVMHSSDWTRIRHEKDGEGHYILGPPGADVQPRLFGLPVVATPAMTVDKFLVGNFQVAGTIYDRWSARVEVATENEDDFIKNLVTVLAEERVGLAVKQPLALTYGDFGNV
jgi:HK97 family phage major capsid protein